MRESFIIYTTQESVSSPILLKSLLPRQYYALAEQQGAAFEPDVLTLKASEAPESDNDASEPPVTSRSNDGEGEEAVSSGVLVTNRVFALRPRLTWSSTG